jgi:hypothetical protein
MAEIPKKPCRCGHPADSKDPHPCHYLGYKCRKPATQRFYNLHVTCLAGMQMKLGLRDTWACDECWAQYLEYLKGEP